MIAIKRRTFLSAATSALFVRAAGSCDASIAARQLRVVAPRHLDGLDLGTAGYFIKNLEIGETLVTVNDSGALVPGLARDIATEDGSLTWRLQLRPNRFFHDGAPVDARAVALALRRMTASIGNPLQGAPIESIREEGDGVIIRMRQPFTLLPALLGASATVILSPSSYAPDGTIRAAIGSGPYRVVSLSERYVLDIEAVQKPSEGGPDVQRVRYRAVPDGETRIRMLEAGDADVALMLAPVSSIRVRHNDRLRVASNATMRVRQVVVNTNYPGLRELAVRRALSLAMDREIASRAVLRNEDEAATQLLPPLMPKWRLPDSSSYRRDVAAAERLLEEAGWQRGRDGIRVRDGQRLAFEMLTVSTRAELGPLAEILQAEWKKIGVAVRIRMCPPETIVSRTTDGTLELAFFARSHFLIPDVASTLIKDFGKSARARPWGAVGWHSDAFDAAAARYTQTTDEKIRSEASHDMLRAVHDEMPVIAHSWYESIVGHSASVANVRVDPFEASYGVSRMRWA